MKGIDIIKLLGNKPTTFNMFLDILTKSIHPFASDVGCIIGSGG